MSALLQAAEDPVASAALPQFHLFGDLYLSDPLFLLLAPLGILALWLGRWRRGARAAGRISVLPAVALPRSLAQRLAWIPPVLQVLAFLAVAVALARPVRGNVERTTTSEGIDIVLVLDRSSSMKYNDLDPRATRLQVVKEVVRDFAVRRMTDRVGAADNIALVGFAQFPQLVCPFTLDVGALTELLESVELARHEVEDGTAIGRGLAKAVALLEDSTARSRVVVLLTDGENNVHDIPPLQAAELARSQDVRVYTISAGRFVYQEDIFGRVYATERQIDTSELEEIARKTGGRSFRARDREGLERIYAEIETLERTPRQERRVAETFDMYPPLLVGALCCYALAWLSFSTWARRLP